MEASGPQGKDKFWGRTPSLSLPSQNVELQITAKPSVLCCHLANTSEDLAIPFFCRIILVFVRIFLVIVHICVYFVCFCTVACFEMCKWSGEDVYISDVHFYARSGLLPLMIIISIFLNFFAVTVVGAGTSPQPLIAPLFLYVCSNGHNVWTGIECSVFLHLYEHV